MPKLDHALVMQPKMGESRSGDAGIIVSVNGGELAAIIDGLGHGIAANEVATRAAEFIEGSPTTDVAALMLRLDQHLRGTIGAAVGLSHVDCATGVLRYASVGNTALRRFGSDEYRGVAQDGVVGTRMRTPRTQQVALNVGDVVLMHTDGVSERFGMTEYPEMLGHSAETIARLVVRQFGKQHDDAGCVVMRYRQ